MTYKEFIKMIKKEYNVSTKLVIKMFSYKAFLQWKLRAGV